MNIKQLLDTFNYNYFLNKSDDWWKEFYPTVELLSDNHFIEKFHSKINWALVPYNKFKNPLTFIKRYFDFILNESYKLKPVEYRSIYIICKFVKLSPQFMIKYRKYLSWSTICTHQALSPRFINKILLFEKIDNIKYIYWYAFKYNDKIEFSNNFLKIHENDINKEKNDYFQKDWSYVENN